MSETAKYLKATNKELPKGWRWAKLGKVCKLNPRRPLINRKDSDPTSFIPMEAVDATSGMVSNVHVRTYGEVKKGYTYFSESDVLFAKITPCMQNGKHAIAKGLIGGIGFGTTEFHVLRPNENIISELIWFFIRQPNILVEATEHFTGAVGQQRVPEGYLANLEIPLPPLPEQRRIAGVLREQMAAVEKARSAAQVRLEAVKALPAAFLREVFPQPGQPLPYGWRWVKLGKVADVVNGFGFAEALQGRTDLPYPFIKVSDMNAPGAEIVIEKAANTVDDGILRHLGARCYPQGTVVFPKVGGALLTNKKRVLGRDSSFDNNIMGVVPRQTDSEFLYYWLCTIDMAVHANTQALPSIRQSLVASFEIPLPQMLEQQRIAGVLSEQMAAFEKARIAAEAELNTINVLPAALLRRAFNGEI